VIPRKFAEIAFRRWWVLLIPTVLAPAAILAFQPHKVEYASVATAWVSRIEGVETAGTFGQPTDSQTTPASAQVQVLGDLLQTAAFRDEVALSAGLVIEGADQRAREQAGELIVKRVQVFEVGPNLMGVRVVAPSAEGAQALGAAVITRFQARALAEGAREAQTVVGYFEKQLALGQDDLAKAQAEAAAYIKAHPTAADKTKVDVDYQSLQGKVDSQTKVVDRLLENLQDARLNAASASNTASATFNVQDQPSLPLLPIAASRTEKYGYPLAGLVMGFSIAAAYLYAAYRLDHTIRSREDVAGLPVTFLGAVPELKPRRRLLVIGRRGGRNFARRVAVSIPPAPGAAEGEAA